jgi:hypothetical protein
MTLVKFNFSPNLQKEEQDELLALLNAPDSWGGIEQAVRLYPDSEDPDLSRQCYFRFTESRSSKGRRNEVLLQHVFNMNIRKKQFEKAWIVEDESDIDELETHPRIWTA